jgi:hypothetical protein
LSAFPRVDKAYRDVVAFSCTASTSRQISEFRFDLPVSIASGDHGKALLAYYLRNLDFTALGLENPSWFDEGLCMARC